MKHPTDPTGSTYFNITIADFQVSEEKPSCESFPHVLGGLVNGPVAPVGWPHVDLGSERRVAGAFQGN